jgi:PadR family transcriptional regulator PadR
MSSSVVTAEYQITRCNLLVRVAVQQEAMAETRSDILQGTLDLMVLQTLEAMGPLHGYGIARRIEQISEDVLQLNQGTIYASLIRLQQRRWIAASWGTSDNNRKAKFYAITRSGRKQLAAQAQNWERISAVMMRLLRLGPR